MSLFVVGVDGGGSNTRALVADENGRTLGSATGPGCAVRPGETEASADVIAATVRDALASANLDDRMPQVLCVGVAGVGREVERERLHVALSERGIAEQVLVSPDAIVALEDAFGDGPGVLLVAGTGSIAYARGPAGTIARCGGWGHVIGDEGSGAWIGRRALSIVAAASDGREPETTLVGAVMTVAEVRSMEELIPWATAASPAEIASLAPAVMQAADTGDLRANALLAMAVEELMLHVRTLARQLFVDERAHIPVAFSGGLLKRGSPLRRRLEHRIRTAVPGAALRADPVVAERGAVRAALRSLGLEMDTTTPAPATTASHQK